MKPVPQIKRMARRGIDRVMRPYVDRLSTNIADAASHSSHAPLELQPPNDDVPAGTSTSDQFHAILHELRTLELERLHQPRHRVLSVGVNGAWYFDWFRRCAGEVDEHVGIEAFEPEPDDLPSYVRWVKNTADEMSEVEASSVDLVFAGQTTEHLWAHELAGFLLESRRVLKVDGALVLDSPNRIVTQHLHWSHGGHTIELDPAEIRHLVTLAGFDVVDVSGIWNCCFDGRRLGLEEAIDVPYILTRRIATGRDAPDDCFVWWINAKRSSREVDAQAVHTAVTEMFGRHWDTRVSRGFFPAVGTDLVISPGATGEVARSLPFPIHSGEWDACLTLESGSWDDIERLRLCLLAPGDVVIHSFELDSADRDGPTMRWRFVRPELLFALSWSLAVGVSAEVTFQFPLTLRLVSE